jgi:hypothetical protein
MRLAHLASPLPAFRSGEFPRAAEAPAGGRLASGSATMSVSAIVNHLLLLLLAECDRLVNTHVISLIAGLLFADSSRAVGGQMLDPNLL